MFLLLYENGIFYVFFYCLNSYLEGKIHVKFLHDNGRRSWINLKNRVKPFNGLADFEKKCEVNKIF